MFGKILVGIDDLAIGGDAIALAKQLGEPGVKLLFAHVLSSDADLNNGSAGTVDPRSRERLEHAVAMLETARATNEADHIGVEISVQPEGLASVGRGLREMVETTGAELVVLGSSRQAPFGRVLLSDQTRSVIDGFPCPVAVAPAGYSLHPAAIRRVGAGYDGSSDSEQALTLAHTLAERHGARVCACAAVSVPMVERDDRSRSITEAIDHLARDASDRIETLNGVQSHAAYDQTTEVLSSFSASVDLLVIGPTLRGPARWANDGEISLGSAQMARCPLFLLPAEGSRGSLDTITV